jgi:hypothetical protein
MDDELDPSRPERPMRGNSREYLLDRLKRDGFDELVAAIEGRELSTYAAAVEVGYRKRPEPTGRGSENAAKRRMWAIHRAYQASGRPDVAERCNLETARNSETTRNSETARSRMRETPHNGRSAPTPDLAAAIREWEEAQRPPRPVRDPAPAPIPPEPVPLERFPIIHSSKIPCANCMHPNAAAAQNEICDVYLAARRGELNLTGSTLPRACCQRLLQNVDVRALIG